MTGALWEQTVTSLLATPIPVIRHCARMSPLPTALSPLATQAAAVAIARTLLTRAWESSAQTPPTTVTLKAHAPTVPALMRQRLLMAHPALTAPLRVYAQVEFAVLRVGSTRW